MRVCFSRVHEDDYDCDRGCETVDGDTRCFDISALDIARRTLDVCLFVVLLANLIILLVRLLGGKKNKTGTDI
jgi:hypothetical protein